MTQRILKIGVLFGVGVSCLLAASAAGTITSTEDFDLSGTRVPVAAVPAWPVVAGDQISTFNSPAYLTMRDGSKFMLRPNSTARIEQNGSKLRVRLMKGDLKFTLANKARTEVASFATLPNNFPVGSASAGAKSAAVAAEAVPDSGSVFLAPALSPRAGPPGPPCTPGSQSQLPPGACAPGLTQGRPPISTFRP